MVSQLTLVEKTTIHTLKINRCRSNKKMFLCFHSDRKIKHKAVQMMPSFQTKQLDCFLSGDDECFAFLFHLQRLIFSVHFASETHERTDRQTLPSA